MMRGLRASIIRYRELRKVERHFQDFKEQNFRTQARAIFEETILALNLNMHCFLIRNLHQDIYNV